MGRGQCPSLINTAFFICPSRSCGKRRASTSGNFKRCNLDHRVHCRFCSKHFLSKLWRCDCNCTWHSCGLHRSYYKCKAHSHGSRMHPTASSADAQPESQHALKRKGCKNDINLADNLETMLAADAKRTRSEPGKGQKRKAETVALGDVPKPHQLKRPTLLGPILAQRFKASLPLPSTSSA